MSIQRKIQKAVEASRTAPEFTIDENPGCLRISGHLSIVALNLWQAVADEQCSGFTLECRDSSDDSVAPQQAQPDENCRITVRFSCPDSTPHLFTIEGWRYFLFDDNKVLLASAIRLAFIDCGFNTRAFKVEPWFDDPISHETQAPARLNDNGPRRHVRCQSPDLMPPAHIEPWIFDGEALAKNPAILVWKAVAAKMIAKSLVNELYKDNGIAKVGLLGQPPRRIDLGDFISDDFSFHALQNAAAWVYLEGDDIEIRHTFLTAELARSWVPGLSFCAGLGSRLDSALDSARLMYKAHLRSGSKDTL